MDCADVQVTFVLGHDEHGHAEESTTGCTRLAADARGRRLARRQRVRRDQRPLPDTGGPGDVPDADDDRGVKIRQRKQQVEHVVNAVRHNVQAEHRRGQRQHRGSLAPGDWIQLNGPFNLVNIDSLTFRVADTADGPHGRLAAGGGRAAHRVRRPGRSCRRTTSRRPAGRASGPARRSRSRWRALNELFLVFRAVAGGQTGNNLFNLNYLEFNGKGVTVIQTSTHGHGRRQRAADAVALARRAGDLRGLHPGRQRGPMTRPLRPT